MLILLTDNSHYCVCMCLVTQSCPVLCDPMDYSLPGISVYGDSPGKIIEQVAMPSSKESSQPRSLTLQVDSLPSEPPGKSKNIGMGSLFLLQGIFLVMYVYIYRYTCMQMYIYS